MPRQRKTPLKVVPKIDERLFPVVLLRNYRPIGTPDSTKVFAGTAINLPVAEARRAIKLGIAERNDPIPN